MITKTLGALFLFDALFVFEALFVFDALRPKPKPRPKARAITTTHLNMSAGYFYQIDMMPEVRKRRDLPNWTNTYTNTIGKIIFCLRVGCRVLLLAANAAADFLYSCADRESSESGVGASS